VATSEFAAQLRSRAGALGVDVPAHAVEPLATYFELLRRWNARINLTALPLQPLTTETLDRLFLEPLAAADQVSSEPGLWYDLGSGGGSPALPLRILRQAGRLVMVEAKSRKAAFLREAIRTLALRRTEVINQRFEELGGREAGDIVTLRGVRAEAATWNSAASVLKVHGRVLVFGSAQLALAPVEFELVDSIPLLRGGKAVLHILAYVPRGTSPRSVQR
jgi:16S rRNA (guanine527-N7)-methyltransferase